MSSDVELGQPAFILAQGSLRPRVRRRPSFTDYANSRPVIVPLEVENSPFSMPRRWSIET